MPVPPPGLVVHCADCKLVIPADAPRGPELDAVADCKQIADTKLAWWNPDETIAGQHMMAAAAWGLIHHKAIQGETPHAESVSYHGRIHRDRQQHFAESAARQAMTEEQVAGLRGHPRDGWLVR